MNFLHVMGVIHKKICFCTLKMEPINHCSKLKVAKQAAWPRKVVIPIGTKQNPSLIWESHAHAHTQTRSCCSFILIGPLQRVMIGYAWLSKAVIFGVTATPPDASDLNSPLCRPACCRTQFCKYMSWLWSGGRYTDA